MSATMRSASTVGYLLQHVAAMLHRQSDQMLQERLGIGMSQYRILAMLDKNPKVEQRRIADSLGQTEASISRQVKLLQEKGMLASQVHPGERRKHITMLTPKGVKVAEAAREMVSDYHEPLFSPLGDKERERLQETLTLLHESICVPNRTTACDRAYAIETIYDNQERPPTNTL